MCGIFLGLSNDSVVINTIESNIEKVKETIESRGPDRLNCIRNGNYIAMHSQLIITGNTPQPVINNDMLLLYNGEIYNDYKSYKDIQGASDTDYLVERYSDEQRNAFYNMDGEYAICIYDFKRKCILLITDTFGTKPLYYQLDDTSCIIGSYDTTVSAAGKRGTIHQVPANTLLVIDLKDFKIKNKKELKKFDFSNQTGNNFDRWNVAFQESIKKRTENNNHSYFVSFSSGHDSGLIVAELLKINRKFKIYTVPFLEDEIVLQKRLEILSENKVPMEIINISDADAETMNNYLHEKLGYYELKAPEFKQDNFSDPDFRNVSGYVAAAIINQKARKSGNIISLSGQGADETIGDYSYGSMKMSSIKGNWENVKKPWKNLMGGWNRIFIGGIERISGLFGIETRYPFLDFDLVQEYINLNPKLKMSGYKPPITNRLIELGFPYHERKQGFAGYQKDGKKYKFGIKGKWEFIKK